MINNMGKGSVVRAGVLALAILIANSVLWAQNRVFDGRMTGGGSVFTDENDLWAPAGTRITHSFQLQCDQFAKPNNLQIEVHLPNGDGGRFHLTELTFAWCMDDPEIDAQTRAPFDTYIGAGIGTFNGQPGYCADWQITDAGERGSADLIRSMRVWHPSNPESCAFESEFVFSIPLGPGHELTFGNHQALATKKTGTTP